MCCSPALILQSPAVKRKVVSPAEYDPVGMFVKKKAVKMP